MNNLDRDIGQIIAHLEEIKEDIVLLRQERKELNERVIQLERSKNIFIGGIIVLSSVAGYVFHKVKLILGAN